ncbi:hypothetical protein BN4901_1351 [Citrobacter europaeus]|uniref:Uncharacterized protein n=1 Tax=Citrobacter europaeus TaxID=1914243 RepID=A0ABY0JLU9_9ENTR|nr:hypothetical protein BN4901_1351 [Citrobacter europaeus]
MFYSDFRTIIANYSGDKPVPVLHTSRLISQPLQDDDWIFGLLKHEYQPPAP